MEKRSYTDLEVWMEARKLTKEVYLITAAYPKEEQFGLTSQMRRCAVSIPSNMPKAAVETMQKKALNSSSYPEDPYMNWKPRCILVSI